LAQELWQTRGDHRHWKLSLVSRVQSRNERSELLLGNVLQLVNEKDDGCFLLCGRLPNGDHQFAQVAIQIAAVSETLLRIDIECHFDIAVFHLQSGHKAGEST